MIIEMNANVKKVAEFMQKEIPQDELQGIAAAIAVISPSIWGEYANKKIQPAKLYEQEIISS